MGMSGYARQNIIFTTAAYTPTHPHHQHRQIIQCKYIPFPVPCFLKPEKGQTDGSDFDNREWQSSARNHETDETFSYLWCHLRSPFYTHVESSTASSIQLWLQVSACALAAQIHLHSLHAALIVISLSICPTTDLLYKCPQVLCGGACGGISHLFDGRFEPW